MLRKLSEVEENLMITDFNTPNSVYQPRFKNQYWDEDNDVYIFFVPEGRGLQPEAHWNLWNNGKVTVDWFYDHLVLKNGDIVRDGLNEDLREIYETKAWFYLGEKDDYNVGA